MTAAGIVRPARRPAGWLAPGPRPITPHGRSDVWPRPGEDLCYLAGDWRILQRIDGHRWSLDDLVTAWVAATAADPPPRYLADLGCGIGTVLLLLAWRFPEARCVGVEAESLSVELARRSAAWNGAAARCEVRLGDLRDRALTADGAVFELVTGTPPYLRPGTATAPRRVQQGPCHFEHRGGVEAYCETGARLLAPGGRFVVCAAAAQNARVLGAAAAAGLAVESRLDVVPREGKAVLFAAYVMRRAGEARPLPPSPPLVVRDGRGRWTPAFRTVRRAMGMPA